MELSKARYGKLLREHRERKGLSQQAVATSLGVRQPTVSSWELGRTSPESLTMLFALSRLLDIDVADLQAITEEEESEEVTA